MGLNTNDMTTITVTLSKQEVDGIRRYLKDVDGKKKVLKSDIVEYITGIVHGTIHAPQEAVSDYIQNEPF